MVVMVVLVLALLRNERRDEFNEVPSQKSFGSLSLAIDPAAMIGRR